VENIKKIKKFNPALSTKILINKNHFQFFLENPKKGKNMKTFFMYFL
jgi:hypothetical protein